MATSSPFVRYSTFIDTDDCGLSCTCRRKICRAMPSLSSKGVAATRNGHPYSGVLLPRNHSWSCTFVSSRLWFLPPLFHLSSITARIGILPPHRQSTSLLWRDILHHKTKKNQKKLEKSKHRSHERLSAGP